MRRAAALLALAILVAPPAHADDATAPRALDWLAAHLATAAPPTYETEVAAAAGAEPHRWPSTDSPVVAALAAQDFASFDLMEWERWTEAVGATGEDASHFAGQDGVAEVRAGFTGGQFGSPTALNDDAWGILALVGAGVAPSDREIQEAATFLKANRDRVPLLGAGWSFSAGATSNTDITGMVLAALAAAGVAPTDADVSAAADWLAATENATSGGWSSFDGIDENADSTAWALIGLRAAGRGEPAAGTAFLAAAQCASGAIRWEPTTDCADSRNGIATTDALLALEGGAFPVLRYAPASLTLPREPHALDVLSFGLAGFGASRAAWDFADGGTSDATSGVTHAYASRGNFTVSVGAWSADGQKTWQSAMLHIGTARPRAVLALAADAWNVTADASGSYDPDGAVVSWRFDWGDGASDTSASAVATHAYASAGNKTVRLVVVDDSGALSDPVLALVTLAAPASAAPTDAANLSSSAAANVSADAVPSANATEPAANDANATSAPANATRSVANASATASATPASSDRVPVTANDTNASEAAPPIAASGARDRVPSPTGADATVRAETRERAGDIDAAPEAGPPTRARPEPLAKSATDRAPPSRDVSLAPVATILLCAALAAWTPLRGKPREGLPRDDSRSARRAASVLADARARRLKRVRRGRLSGAPSTSAPSRSRTPRR
ncbi:MAG: PKD domain-containing protein [Thermoplasmatota archaeon]